LLGSDDIGTTTVVADLEAGLGTLTRMGETPIDVVLLIVEPSAKSVEVGRRAVALLQGRPIGRLIVVGNKVTGEEDAARLREAFAAHELVIVPDDPAVRDADRAGASPLDHAPGCPAVVALTALAERVVPAA
jgi:CO dehydrogenase maturation factor